MAKKKEIEMVENKTEEKEKELDVNALKVEILEFAKNQVSAEVEKEIQKANEKYIKEKKRAIVRKNIIIILLVIGYLITLGFLINDHYFDKYLTKGEVEVIEKINKKGEDNKTEENDKEEEKKRLEEEKKKLEEEKKKLEEEKKKKEEEQKRLQAKYQDVFNGFVITKGNKYLESFYDNKKDSKLLLSIALENINEDNVEVDNDMYMIYKDHLINKVKELFNVEIEPTSFEYNDIEVKYLKNINYFILDKKFSKNGIKIERIVSNIEEDNKITIKTYEYYVKDGIVYNPANDREICTINEVNNYKEYLSEKTYVVVNNDSRYIFEI